MKSLTAAARKIMLLGLLATMIPAISACNTVKGAGKDVKAAGQGIENGAEKVQNDIED